MSRGQSKQAVVLSRSVLARIANEVLGNNGSSRKDPAVLAAESSARCAFRKAASRHAIADGDDEATANAKKQKQLLAVCTVAEVLYGVQLLDDDNDTDDKE